MLSEVTVYQNSGTRRRRYFCDAVLGLYLFFEPDDSLFGFQLIYRLPGFPPLSATWDLEEKKLFHHSLHEAERGSAGWDEGPSMAQIEPELFDRDRVVAVFQELSEGLDPAWRKSVVQVLEAPESVFLPCESCEERRPASIHCFDCHLRVCDSCLKREELGRGSCPARRSKSPSERRHYWYDLFRGSYGCAECRAKRK